MSVRTLSYSLKSVLSQSLCGLVICEFVECLVFCSSTLIYNAPLHTISQLLLTVFTTLVFCALHLEIMNGKMVFSLSTYVNMKFITSAY